MTDERNKWRFAGGSWVIALALALVLACGFSAPAYADDQPESSDAASLEEVVEAALDEGSDDEVLPVTVSEPLAESAGSVSDNSTGNEEADSADADERVDGNTTVTDNTTSSDPDDKAHSKGAADEPIASMTSVDGGSIAEPLSSGQVKNTAASVESSSLNGLSDDRVNGASDGAQTESGTGAATDATADVDSPSPKGKNEASADDADASDEEPVASKPQSKETSAQSRAQTVARGSAPNSAAYSPAPVSVGAVQYPDYTSVYKEAASEVQEAPEPETQAEEMAPRPLLRYPGTAPVLPSAFIAAGSPRIDGPLPTSHYAITFEGRSSDAVSVSSLAREASQQQGALLYEKARCRSP